MAVPDITPTASKSHTPGRIAASELHVNPDVHSKQIPSTRPHPSFQLDVNPDVHNMQIPDLVALGVGLGAPGAYLARVLFPASGALKNLK